MHRAVLLADGGEIGAEAIEAGDEALAVRLMDEHLSHVESSLTLDRKVPSNDISMALA